MRAPPKRLGRVATLNSVQAGADLQTGRHGNTRCAAGATRVADVADRPTSGSEQVHVIHANVTRDAITGPEAGLIVFGIPGWACTQRGAKASRKATERRTGTSEIVDRVTYNLNDVTAG